MRIFFIFFLGLLYEPVYGEDLFKSLEKTYQEIQDFKATFEQIEIHGLLKKEKKTQGVIYSLPQGKIFWYTQTLPSFKVISDGTTVWLYYPKDNQVFKETWGNLDSQTQLALLFLRREANLRKYFTIRRGKQKSFILRPKKSLIVEKIVLFLTADSKKVFLKKVKFFYPLNRTTELTLKEVKFNQNLFEKHKQIPLDENIDPFFKFVASPK